jgi:hypothetical protein
MERSADGDMYTFRAVRQMLFIFPAAQLSCGYMCIVQTRTTQVQFGSSMSREFPRRLSGATFDLQGRSRLSAERLRALTVLTTRYFLEQIELSWLILCHNRRRDTTGMLRVIPRALRRLAALVLHAEAVLLLFLPWLRVILVYPDGAHLTSGRL